eukprot:augustus_masked-scaffold_7-processed-gene-18.7-mRNA-1 protein AED:1.00 eAED:1.00 QI:0/0/0/0/1/1/2/0/779
MISGPEHNLYEANELDFEGRDRLDTSGYSLPPCKLTELNEYYKIKCIISNTVISLNKKGPLCIRYFRKNMVILEDTPIEAYGYHTGASRWQSRFTHSSVLSEDYIYGVGESAGKANRLGRKIELHTTDSMGYDAKNSSTSLYKHFPTYYGSKQVDGEMISYGVIYDHLTRCTFDFGNKISAFKGSQKTFSVDSNFLDFYILLGDSLKDIVKSTGKFLIGRPRLPPVWSLGYMASSMLLSDLPKAQERFEVPCSGFYLSSGYTLSHSGNRNVFTWSKENYPEPEQLFKNFVSKGVHVLPNVKPWYLNSHPRFDFVCNEALLISPEEVRQYFWKGDAGTFKEGSYFDFTSAVGRKEWIDGCQSQLLKLGASGIWNDNNEYEVSSGSIMSSAGSVLDLGPQLQTLLMSKCSLAAQTLCGNFNQRDALVVSRSGCLGIHRYASQTWSGDNTTSWKTMKYNIPMSLSLGLSLWVGNGFDIGGFTGTKVSKEMLLRWVQVGVWFGGRFTIHSSSWKKLEVEDPIYAVNSPWMFEHQDKKILSEIRRMIKLRHILLPTIYSCYIEAYLEYNPICRLLAYEFPAVDEITWSESFEFMLGRSLLVSGVFEPGVDKKSVYLPGKSEQWLDLSSKNWFAGGMYHQISAPLYGLKTGIPVFLRNKSGYVTLSDEFKDGNPTIPHRRIVFLCSSSGHHTFSWYEKETDSDIFFRICVSSDITDGILDIKDINVTVLRNSSSPELYEDSFCSGMILPFSEILFQDAAKEKGRVNIKYNLREKIRKDYNFQLIN